jgi:outer membrane protein TolC
MVQHRIILGLLAWLTAWGGQTQTLTLEAVMDSIRLSHPAGKMYDNEIRAMDESAKGARSWMPPEISTGVWMLPYNSQYWKKTDMGDGMGQYMIGVQQMFPSRKKLDADEAYMTAMSSVEREKREAALHELMHDGRQYYFEWLILKKRLSILAENERILEFMKKNAEIRYKHGLEKISAYYKVKAALGEIKNMQLMYEAGIRGNRIRLNTLMGRNPRQYFDIDSSYPIRDFADLSVDTALFYGNRSDLRSIDRQINLAHLKQEAEKQNLRPQFGVRYDNMIGLGGQPLQFTLMGMVRIPMARWSSKMGQAGIESLKWQSDALQSQKQMMVNAYRGMAYGMLNELELKKAQLNLYETSIIPALKNNFTSMLGAYEQNTEELYMLYDAWETLNMKQMTYLELLDEALRLQTGLERLIQQQ